MKPALLVRHYDDQPDLDAANRWAMDYLRVHPRHGNVSVYKTEVVETSDGDDQPPLGPLLIVVAWDPRGVAAVRKMEAHLPHGEPARIPADYVQRLQRLRDRRIDEGLSGVETETEPSVLREDGTLEPYE